jgi:hypothetical protein
MHMQSDGVAVNMTIQITRAGNGVTEEFNLTLSGLAEPKVPVIHDVIGTMESQSAEVIQS